MITSDFYWSDNPRQITTSYWKHRLDEGIEDGQIVQNKFTQAASHK